MTPTAAEYEDSKRFNLRTVRSALVDAAGFLLRAGIETARLDAEVLLRQVLAIDQTKLYLEIEEPLLPTAERPFRDLLRRRAQREPLAYITGQKEFWSLDFIVNPAVLIPRPETELLVELALDDLKSRAGGTAPTLFDLGTGSGAIAVCLAKERSDVDIWAGDVSSAALEVARANALRHGLSDRVRWVTGDLFAGLDWQKPIFDLIVSNPPYVRTEELTSLEPEIREWEPVGALDGGTDGLDVYRRIIWEAHNYLLPGGKIMLEIGADMGPSVVELFERSASYGPTSVFQDHAGRDRVVTAMKLPASGKGADHG
ncbi:MAG: peptide chain release factor N(5)-glutamine methyltransferase [Candidatus Binatia bacterium]